jgi:hypothetical protein
MWLDIIKFINDNFHKIKYQKEENRKRIAKILEEISNSIEGVSSSLKSDLYPHYSCMVLSELANNFVSELKGSIEDEKLDTFHKLLLQASNIETQYALRKEENVISQLDSISAKFKAISLLCK